MNDHDFAQGLLSQQERTAQWADNAEHLLRLKTADQREQDLAERKVQLEQKRQEKEKTAMSKDWLVEFAAKQPTDSARLESALAELPFEEIEKLAYDAQVEEGALGYQDFKTKVAQADQMGRELAQKHGEALLEQIVGQEKTAGALALVDALRHPSVGRLGFMAATEGAGGLMGNYYGKKQHERGEEHTFGLPQAAALTLLPGGMGYQAGRAYAHAKGQEADKQSAKEKTAGIAGQAATLGQKVVGGGLRALNKSPTAALGAAGAVAGAGVGAATAKPGEGLKGALGGAAIGGGLGAGAGALGAGKLVQQGVMGKGNFSSPVLGQGAKDYATGALAATKKAPGAAFKPEAAMRSVGTKPLPTPEGAAARGQQLSAAKAGAGQEMANMPDPRKVMQPAKPQGLMSRIGGMFGKQASGLGSPDGESHDAYFARMMGG